MPWLDLIGDGFDCRPCGSRGLPDSSLIRRAGYAAIGRATTGGVAGVSQAARPADRIRCISPGTNAFGYAYLSTAGIVLALHPTPRAKQVSVRPAGPLAGQQWRGADAGVCLPGSASPILAGFLSSADAVASGEVEVDPERLEASRGRRLHLG